MLGVAATLFLFKLKRTRKRSRRGTYGIFLWKRTSIVSFPALSKTAYLSDANVNFPYKSPEISTTEISSRPHCRVFWIIVKENNQETSISH
jgi:hypothetical protein